MGMIRGYDKALLVMGVISADPEKYAGQETRITDVFGPVSCRSASMDFDFTEYYSAEMGSPLKRWWLIFEKRIEQMELGRVKMISNSLETEFSAGPRRMINLDPGIMLPSKLVLASTKDAPHRVAIGDGIYAEITLVFHKGTFMPLKWTYPDYRSETALAFFLSARKRFIA